MPKFTKVNGIEKKPEQPRSDRTMRQPTHGEPMFDHYEIDPVTKEMVGVDLSIETPAPQIRRCQCGSLWDEGAYVNDLCPRCRVFAQLDAKSTNSEPRYIKRDRLGNVTFEGDPEPEPMPGAYVQDRQ